MTDLPSYAAPEPIEPSSSDAPAPAPPTYPPTSAPPAYAPVSAAPTSAAPTSAVPGYAAPSSAAPTSAVPGYAVPTSAVPGYAPVSGVPGYAPISAMPASGFPASAPPGYPPVAYPTVPIPPVVRKGRSLLTTIVAVVAVLAAATFGVLYAMKSSAYDREVQLASDRATTISVDEAKLNQTKADLDTANAANAKLEAQVGDVQNQLTEITHEKDVIAKCINDNDKVFTAIEHHQSTAKVNKLIATADESCSEADKYLS